MPSLEPKKPQWKVEVMPKKQTPAATPALHIVLYSNFEGFCADVNRARQIVEGFESFTNRYPQIVWTHMFNPVHLVGSGAKRDCGAVFLPWLHSLIKRQPLTDVGLHTHLFFPFIEALGLKPRREPCGTANDGGGYSVLLTGYPQSEQKIIIQKSVEAFTQNGLPGPTTFCAGYSATDSALQAFLEKAGFTASFAGQVIPPGIPGISHHPCWYQLLEWGENLTPLSRPYRVGKNTILPTATGPWLDRLVEIPLIADQDIRQLYLYGQPVSRRNVLDFHYEFVRATGRSSCVPLGVHDCYLEEGRMRGPVLDEMAASLDHVQRIIQRGDVPVRFSTAAEVSRCVHAEPGL